jgi:hypothetical protein
LGRGVGLWSLGVLLRNGVVVAAAKQQERENPKQLCELDIDFHFEKSGETCSPKQTGEDKRASDNCPMVSIQNPTSPFCGAKRWSDENRSRNIY